MASGEQLHAAEAALEAAESGEQLHAAEKAAAEKAAEVNPDG